MLWSRYLSYDYILKLPVHFDREIRTRFQHLTKFTEFTPDWLTFVGSCLPGVAGMPVIKSFVTKVRITIERWLEGRCRLGSRSKWIGMDTIGICRHTQKKKNVPNNKFLDPKKKNQNKIKNFWNFFVKIEIWFPCVGLQLGKKKVQLEKFHIYNLSKLTCLGIWQDTLLSGV